jgi:hypothetical protein
VTVECATSADRAFAFLTDGGALGHWAFGCWGAAPCGEGLFVGRSLFDDQETWVRIVGDGSANSRASASSCPARSPSAAWRW